MAFPSYDIEEGSDGPFCAGVSLVMRGGSEYLGCSKFCDGFVDISGGKFGAFVTDD